MEDVVVEDLQPVPDLPHAEPLPSQRDRLLPQSLEVRVLATGMCHRTSVVRNADVRVERVLGSPDRAIYPPLRYDRSLSVLTDSPENGMRPPVGWMP
jgi:hypothetical protein